MKILKIFGFIVLATMILFIGAFSYLKYGLPNVDPAPDLKVSQTSELIERGEYLANHVSVCMDCHSTRDWNKFSGPLVPNTLGKGGELFSRDFGFPGKIYSKNITPSGVGHWSDGDLYRLITSGVTPEDEVVFPLMPFRSYNKMASEDIHAIIAYLRTLDPIDNEVPESQIDFPVSLFINLIPKAAEPSQIPEKSDLIAYGSYLTNAAGCADCHTPQENGEPIEGQYLAGGFEFKLPGFGTVRSANITPSSAGIGNWTQDQFVQRFKQYSDSSYTIPTVSKSSFQTVMPWTQYTGMKEEDIRAIFAYLQSQTPIEKTVALFTPETQSLSTLE